MGFLLVLLNLTLSNLERSKLRSKACFPYISLLRLIADPWLLLNMNRKVPMGFLLVLLNLTSSDLESQTEVKILFSLYIFVTVDCKTISTIEHK